MSEAGRNTNLSQGSVGGLFTHDPAHWPLFQTQVPACPGVQGLSTEAWWGSGPRYAWETLAMFWVRGRFFCIPAFACRLNDQSYTPSDPAWTEIFGVLSVATIKFEMLSTAPQSQVSLGA